MKRRWVAAPGVTSGFFYTLHSKTNLSANVRGLGFTVIFCCFELKTTARLWNNLSYILDGAYPDYLRYSCSCPKPFVFGFCLLQIKFSSPKTGKVPCRCRQQGKGRWEPRQRRFPASSQDIIEAVRGQKRILRLCHLAVHRSNSSLIKRQAARISFNFLHS